MQNRVLTRGAGLLAVLTLAAGCGDGTSALGQVTEPTALLVSALGGMQRLTPLTPVKAPDPLAAMVDETPQSWFVELSLAPSIEGTDLASLQAEKETFRAKAREDGITFTERRSFAETCRAPARVERRMRRWRRHRCRS